MKMLLTASLITLLPALALAQATTNPATPDAAKPKPFMPVLARDHEGAGRIGVRIVFDKTTGLPQIGSLTRGGPAADFGLRVGDIIIKIDKNYTSTLTEEEVHLALRGRPGTGVELTIQRDDNPCYVFRAVERRVLRADSDEMINPPMSGVAKL